MAGRFEEWTQLEKSELNEHLILKHYAQGFSTRQVADILGHSKSKVARVVAQHGASRDKSLAGQLRKPPRSRHWRTTRSMARRIFTRRFGPIPKGYHIHHKDGDFTNNDVNNLECLQEAEHRRLHSGKLWERK